MFDLFNPIKMLPTVQSPLNDLSLPRMKLLVQTSQVWQKDGLNSCSYKTLSLERTPLYVNITVDIGKPSS